MDMRTFFSLGLYGVCAVTAVTAQNTRTVSAVLPVPKGMLRRQLEAVLGEFRPGAVKIGMLASRGNIGDVVGAITSHSLTNVVLDTILFSSGGTSLLEGKGLTPLKRDLFPLATVATANLKEAGLLSGIRVRDRASMEEAAVTLHALGALMVVIKGGHLKGSPDDLLYDGRKALWLTGTRIRGDFHGLGCVLSSAIAGYLALGCGAGEAVKRGKEFLEHSLKGSAAPRGGRRVITLAGSRSGCTPFGS